VAWYCGESGMLTKRLLLPGLAILFLFGSASPADEETGSLKDTIAAFVEDGGETEVLVAPVVRLALPETEANAGFRAPESHPTSSSNDDDTGLISRVAKLPLSLAKNAAAVLAGGLDIAKAPFAGDRISEERSGTDAESFTEAAIFAGYEIRTETNRSKNFFQEEERKFLVPEERCARKRQSGDRILQIQILLEKIVPTEKK